MSKATSLLIAHFALQNTTSNSVKKKNRPREGVAKKEGWGEFRHARANTKSGQDLPSCLFRVEPRTKVFFSF